MPKFGFDRFSLLATPSYLKTTDMCRLDYGTERSKAGLDTKQSPGFSPVLYHMMWQDVDDFTLSTWTKWTLRAHATAKHWAKDQSSFTALGLRK